MTNFPPAVVDQLKNGQIGIIPTDTLYGLVGSALNPHTVEKIYELKKRSKDKPMIILISKLEDLDKLGIVLSDQEKEFLSKIWPNPVSIILPCNRQDLSYLHRGKNTLAVRMPEDRELLELLKQSGPLVAPSANFEGEPPSKNIDEAKNYFGNNVAFYVDAGNLVSEPSTLIELKNGHFNVLRQGKFVL